MGLLDGFAHELPGDGARVGGTKTIHCKDGSTRPCSGGTQGCYDNSPMYCGRGALTQHTCSSDASVFWCRGGTRDCTDDSPAHCPPAGAGGGPSPSQPACEAGSLALCVDGGYRPLRDLYRSSQQAQPPPEGERLYG